MFNKKRKRKISRRLIVQTNPKSIISEQFRIIRTNIKFSMPDKELKTILITSAVAGEGKSTISVNLAGVFAQEGKKVLLIDGDMRKPTIHYTFFLKNILGLSSVLTRQCQLSEAIYETEMEGFFVMPCGPIPPNPAELLASKQMDLMIEVLTKEFDILIFDVPPVLSVTDAQILSNKCDATILVACSRETPKNSIIKAKELLEMSKANIIGVIINNKKKVKRKPNEYYYGA